MGKRPFSAVKVSSRKMQVPCAGGGKGAFASEVLIALRGRRQRAAAPLATPAGASPLDPDSMHSLVKRLARMLMDNWEQAAAHAYFGMPIACWHTKGMCRWLVLAASIKCRGSGGRLALPAGSARGGARSQS